MEKPVCAASYSNKCDVTQVPFLGSVMMTVNQHLKVNGTMTAVQCKYSNCLKPGSHAQPLQRCGGCQLVSYCSKACQKNDRSTHKYVCKEFPIVNGKNALYNKGSWKNHQHNLQKRASKLPHAGVGDNALFLNPRVCQTCRESQQEYQIHCKCTAVSYCNTICAKSDSSHKKKCGGYAHMVRVSLARSLQFVLETFPGKIGQDHRPLHDLTTLNVHIVTSNPLFDSVPWEELMHTLPNLKELKLAFIMQGKPVRHSFMLNRELSLQRCDDCANKNRVISYSVYQMRYHMFFSSETYTEPDFVVVYRNSLEMSSNGLFEMHGEISYSNMVHSHKTVLILMDETKELVSQSAGFVNMTQPIDQIVSPSFNMYINHKILDSVKDQNIDIADMNDKSYFTCLRRK